MIIVKTPLRMSFVGGGSDLYSYYSKSIGAVVSTSINKYVYVILNKKFDDGYRISYSITENVKEICNIKHPIVRETLSLMDIHDNIEIVSIADIHSKGTGLGSSSSFSVGLINALSKYKELKLTKHEIANLACKIEIEKCGEPIGKQDQFAASYGGLNLITFEPDNTTVTPIQLNSDTLRVLESSILVFYTGKTRQASSILASQKQNLKKAEKRDVMKKMVDLAFLMKSDLEKNNLTSFGEILHENWELKKQLAVGISNSEIDKWYQIGLDNGAIGGKILGAGNGGFLMFYAPKSLHDRIINSLNFLQTVDFKFDLEGTKFI